MLRYLSIFVLMLVVCIPFVVAEPSTIGGGEPSSGVSSTAEQNRYLTAEAKKELATMKDELLVALQENQDLNFGTLDSRMVQLMADIRIKIILAGIGAVIAAQSLFVYLLLRSFKSYSYETYLEKILGEKLGQTQSVSQTQDLQQQGLDQMQEQQWYPQEVQPTISTEYGQVAASDMSYMNEWQHQPVYDGAYQAPPPSQYEQDHDRYARYYQGGNQQ